MTKALTLALGALTMLGGAARAQDAASPAWWLVAGDARAPAIVFVDEASIVRDRDTVRFNALQYDRAGSVHSLAGEADCRAPADPAGRFACASRGERMRSALLLGTLDPTQVVGVLTATLPRHGPRLTVG